MFDDPNKELEQLKQQLLKEEEWFERELDSAKRMIGQVPDKKAKKTTATRTAAAEKKPASSQAQEEKPRKQKGKKAAPKKKSNKGLVILASLETLGIVGIVAYWLLVLLK